MSKTKQPFLLALFLLANASVFAQTSANEAGGMEAGGKIYVVMAVVITILAGLLLYVLRLDRRISKIEREEKP